jgi:hypothetical protein
LEFASCLENDEIVRLLGEKNLVCTLSVVDKSIMLIDPEQVLGNLKWKADWPLRQTPKRPRSIRFLWSRERHLGQRFLTKRSRTAVVTFDAKTAAVPARESDCQFDLHRTQHIVITPVNPMATMKKTVIEVKTANQAWFPTNRGGLFHK